MTSVQAGVQALGAVETRLKELASSALTSNEWEAVTILAAWARAIRTLLDEASLHGERSAGTPLRGEVEVGAPSTAMVSSPRPSAPGLPKIDSDGPRPEGAIQSKEHRRPGALKPIARERQAPARKTYPQFARQADTLIKVGWSKKARKEYQHQAPKRVLHLLTAAIQKIAAKDPRFTVEQLLPEIDLRNDAGTPSYQTYLCVAWLRSHDLLEQHGRQGYSVREPSHFADAVEKAWLLTPTNK